MKALRLFNLTLLLTAPLLVSSGYPTSVQHKFQPLTDQEMAGIVGGDGCKDCHYTGERVDECYHTNTWDTCVTNKCTASFSLEDTCDLGSGTCNAILNTSIAGSVTYIRADSGCTHSGSGQSTWYTHYYGSSCTAKSGKARCIKNNGSCDGTLISSSSFIPAIQCQ